jgi:hypothetical protein
MINIGKFILAFGLAMIAIAVIFKAGGMDDFNRKFINPIVQDVKIPKTEEPKFKVGQLVKFKLTGEKCMIVGVTGFKSNGVNVRFQNREDRLLHLFELEPLKEE